MPVLLVLSSKLDWAHLGPNAIPFGASAGPDWTIRVIPNRPATRKAADDGCCFCNTAYFPVILRAPAASNSDMVRRATQIGLLLLFFTSGLFAGPSGTFLGTLVSPSGNHSEARWIYVKGKNGVIRRVEISAAKVGYAENIPAEQQKQPAAAALQPGTEIRVTASQDANGEWRASRVEITAAVKDIPPADSDDTDDADSDSEGTLPDGLRVI